MRKLFFIIPVVLALLVSAVFPVQKAMAAATASWTCVTGGATVTYSGLAPGDEIFVTTPTGNTFIENPPSPASGTRTFLDGNGTYTASIGGIPTSITCTTTPTTVTNQNPSDDPDGDGLTGSADPCPNDKNAVKDKNGYCPSDETGKRLTNGSIVVYDMNDSTEIQFYTGDGKKLGGVDQSWLEDFASTPPGTTINLPTRDGKSYSLTNGGNGRYSGKYDGKDFSFYLPGLVIKPVCDPAALAAAKKAAEAAQAKADAAKKVADAARAVAVEAKAVEFATREWDGYESYAWSIAAHATEVAQNDALDKWAAAIMAQDDANAAQAVYDSLKKDCP